MPSLLLLTGAPDVHTINTSAGMLFACWAIVIVLLAMAPVSYTHLDVYKRQAVHGPQGFKAVFGSHMAHGATDQVNVCLLYTSYP